MTPTLVHSGRAVTQMRGDINWQTGQTKELLWQAARLHGAELPPGPASGKLPVLALNNPRTGIYVVSGVSWGPDRASCAHVAVAERGFGNPD